ncbi:MAG TPA: hypothetical protein VJJ52_02055 [Candidatus Nanoarchaeia archaeon]|nr:hypothetical protein [Candidatus Nanoarchaeia archaeon]
MQTMKAWSESTMKVKRASGEVVEYTKDTISEIFSRAGLAGGELAEAVEGVFESSKNLAKEGVVRISEFEKVIIDTAESINDSIVDGVRDATKRILK